MVNKLLNPGPCNNNDTRSCRIGRPIDRLKGIPGSLLTKQVFGFSITLVSYSIRILKIKRPLVLYEDEWFKRLLDSRQRVGYGPQGGWGFR